MDDGATVTGVVMVSLFWSLEKNYILGGLGVTRLFQPFQNEEVSNELKAALKASCVPSVRLRFNFENRVDVQIQIVSRFLHNNMI
jgi:hypothetical protein